MIAYRKQLGILPKVPAPQAALLCLHRGLPERLRRKHPFRRVGRLMGDLFAIGKAGNALFVAANFGIGAPLIASFAEELIAWGVKRLISLAWVGALQPELNPGDIVVCERAMRDEGTSHHYLPAAKYAQASERLVGELVASLASAGVVAASTTSWTTDAPYRETKAEVKKYQAEGVATVEMEAAALFTVATVRNVEAAAIFVVGDSLADLEWRGPRDLASIERGLETAYTAAISTLTPGSK